MSRQMIGGFFIPFVWWCIAHKTQMKGQKMKPLIISGIKPTGKPHLGNYVGMLKPSLDLAKNKFNDCYYFIPDGHALNSIQDAATLKKLVHEITATYLALGLEPDQTTLYKQSDITEVFQLSQILACICPKGFMNRAHAYKSAQEQNKRNGTKELDHNINMGLYTYPILMAADILILNANIVPVGEDQKQHVEYARDLALKFNTTFEDIFSIPEPEIRKDCPSLAGIDGRKMSKIYKNTIPIFAEPDELKKYISKIKTDSKQPGEKKKAEDSLIFAYYKEISTEQEANIFKQEFQDGMSYADAKNILFEKICTFFHEPRLHYSELIKNTDYLDTLLKEGAEKVKPKATAMMSKIKQAVGI